MSLRRALGYLAALPVSVLAAAAVPFVLATGGRARIREGLLEAAGGLLDPLLTRAIPSFAIGAITLGHVVLAADARALEESRDHERVHVAQYERFGVLFPLLYLAASLRAVVRGGSPYQDNPFEKEACLRAGGAAAFHRDTIEQVAVVVELQDPVVWTAPRKPGKWSPSEIAQHLVISYEPALAELDGGAGFAMVLPWWKRTALRWTVLPRILDGRFPKGAPAPREARPRTGAASPGEAARALRENAARFERRLVEAHAVRPVRLTHAYFGRLTAVQILKLVAVHAVHHRDQFPPPRRG